MSEAMDFKVIGTRPVRPDGVDKVTGRASFGADFSLPGMLEGAVLRSPHAHARIKSIKADAALAAPGVKAVVTGADFPQVAAGAIEGGEGGGDFADLAGNVIARGKVRYHGHAVAAVAAQSRAQALAALALIEVEYEPLPAVLSLDAALAESAPLIDEGLMTSGLAEPAAAPSNLASVIEMGNGDLEAGFADAALVIERRYHTPTVHQGYIEPHACVGRWGQDDQAMLWCCTQGAFDVRSMTAKVLGQPVGSLKVIPSEIGGGFGGKTTVYLEPLALQLSKKSGRPVRMVMTREEVFRATGPASAATIDLRMGFSKDGKITAAEAIMAYEAGAFPALPWARAPCACSPPTGSLTSALRVWTCW